MQDGGVQASPSPSMKFLNRLQSVSWIRKKDLHILTVGTFAYTKDDRYSTMHLDNSDDWTLEIRYPEKSDEGVYECQVSTVPKMSLKVQLNVVDEKDTIIVNEHAVTLFEKYLIENCHVKTYGDDEYAH
ncbi:hypothetical protein GQR58_004681 [Nymphon striatum]|nr:hypothetical protein GQR58_004681 [Nymphon striatum]